MNRSPLRTTSAEGASPDYDRRATVWHTPAELAPRLRMTTRQVQGLCASRQIAWRPKNTDSLTTYYLISEEAVQAYERAVTRPALVKPLRRISDHERGY